MPSVLGQFCAWTMYVSRNKCASPEGYVDSEGGCLEEMVTWEISVYIKLNIIQPKKMKL